MKILSLTEIKNSLLNSLKNSLSKIEGTFNYDIVSMCSIGIKELYGYMEWWGKQSFIDTATEDNYIDKHAEVFGVFRLASSKAKGEITIEGKVGATIKKGFVVIGRNSLRYITTTPIVLNSKGVGTGTIECEIGGSIGNCLEGEITTFEIIEPEVFKVINMKDVEGGYDIESNSSLIERAKEKVRKPAHSGNKNNYLQWSKEVPGVGDVVVLGTWNGPGTVKVIIGNSDGDIANSLLIDATKNYIEDNRRPIGANVTVVSFIEFKVRVSAILVLSDNYNIELINLKIKEELNLALKKGELSYKTISNTNILSFSKINNIILEIEGVIDVLHLKINDSNTNIEIGDEYLIKIGEVDTYETN